MSRLLKRLLGWALGLALLAWLLGAWAPQGGWALAQQTWQRMQAVPLGIWALGLLLWWSSFVWRAVRMRQEWRWRRTVCLRQALQVVLVHNAAVLLLPMRAGELGYPLLVRQVWSATWPQAMRSLLWLRMQDALVLALLAACLWPGVPSTWRLAALGLAALGGGGLWWLARRGMGAPAWWRRGLLGRNRLGQVLRLLVQRRRSRGGWGLCLGNWLTKLLVVGGLLQALAGPSTGLTLLGFFLLARWLVRSKYGRVLQAIRDAESRVMFSGYSPLPYKLSIWVISAVMCAVAGALYVPQVGIINPGEMSAANSIEIAVWAAVGGRASLVGPIVGAFLVNGAKSWLTVTAPEFWLYFLGALFIVVTLYLPHGVVGLLRKPLGGLGLFDKFKRKGGAA